MTFDLVVLGSSGSHTAPGQVCSGYLLEHDGTRVLLDCGNGSSANLQRYTAIEDLDAVVVSHRHVDHCVDLIGMFYALRFHADGPRSVDLYAAAEVVDSMTTLLSRDSALAFRDAFRTHEVGGGDRVTIGSIELRFFPSVHPVPTVSVRAAADGAVLAYSADSGGGDDLVACARGADLFLCEATWQGDAGRWPADIHLTARQAGEHATAAGVGRLLLTHIVGSADREVSRQEARETFAGPVDLAVDGGRWRIDAVAAAPA